MTDPRIEAVARAICKEFMKNGKALGAARLCTQDAFFDLAHVSLAAADAAAWRPIASAPKDGTLILVTVKHIGCDVVSFWGTGWRETTNGLMLRDEPTHWQSLPTPPNATPQAAPDTITIPEVRNDRPIPGKDVTDG
ncbi:MULTISPECIES: DUF551 domain-containing protein [Acetobacter]|uniref:DUF551 domain-containing protein n=1 Tax=Acetobacter lovaniensis TaxID=104100 RepID=A0A841QF66_9PROT|nr:DUF551 domain-containing protein [Acetobacter lovaniensis]MBB6457211.1 hypothetical protein [Acetobacter lovaniensis]NHN81210.1 hypothetical protein [Acetobacter lovaniensis]